MASSNPTLALVRALVQVIDSFDPSTRGHSTRIAAYTTRVARQLGVPEPELEAIECGALLHDIGRTAILNDVLLRPRPLDARERALLHSHPTIGYEIVKDLPGLERAAEIIHAHHEQPDGRGYPRGLTEAQIPLGARIISVAAAFDAMTQDRPYRNGLPLNVAIEELREHSGTQFFPEVVEAFVHLQRRGTFADVLDPPVTIDVRHAA